MKSSTGDFRRCLHEVVTCDDSPLHQRLSIYVVSRRCSAVGCWSRHIAPSKKGAV